MVALAAVDALETGDTAPAKHPRRASDRHAPIIGTAATAGIAQAAHRLHEEVQGDDLMNRDNRRAADERP
jgi:hypothetical protein